MNHYTLEKTTEMYEKVYTQLINTVTEQEALDTWNMYKLDIDHLRKYNKLAFDILYHTYKHILLGHDKKGEKNVSREDNTT
jgi:hypothetical protein